jgi:hypothetical protein
MAGAAIRAATGSVPHRTGARIAATAAVPLLMRPRCSRHHTVLVQEGTW